VIDTGWQVPIVLSKETVTSAALKFFSTSDLSEHIDYLSSQLPERVVLYIIGGSIRNLIMELAFGNAPKTGDIDLFIGGLPDDFSLSGLLEGEVFEETDLGGVRWHPKSSDVAFDLCLLPKFVLVQKYRLRPTRENLLNCIDFTVNAIVFDVTAGKLYERKCIAAIENRCMDFNTHRFYTKQLLAYRILFIRYKTGFMLSEAIFSYMKHQLALPDLSDLKGLFKKKLGKKKARVLMSDYDHLCSFSNYADYEGAAKRQALHSF
jgi:hypothetical protein